MKNILIFFFLLFVFVVPFITKAQSQNNLLETQIAMNDSNEKHVMLDIAMNNFFKNNEYFNDISTGYTLIGSQLATQIAYMPRPNIRIQTGVFFHKDFGNDTMLIVKPLLTMKYQKNGYSFLFGNLESNFSHRMVEPLYNYERYITHPLESGLQFKIDRPNIWSDSWLNWEKMEYVGSNFQERFSVGHHTNYSLFQNKKDKLTIDGQFIFSHRGGQIDIDTTPLQTIVNTAIGITYTLHFNRFLFKQFKTESYYINFFDLSPTSQLAYSKGRGISLNVSTSLRHGFQVAMSYWDGFQFVSSRGGTLFQSIASEYGKVGYVEPQRQLLFLRVQYARKVLDMLNVDVRFEPFIDLNKSTLEYAYSLYFTYKNDFSIFNFCKKK